VYASWSDGGAQSHSITAPSSAATYTANFTTQFYLTTSAETGGTIGQPSEWVNSGAQVQISASASAGYQFSGFTGGLSGTTTPQTLPPITGPVTVTATFSVSGGATVAAPAFSPPAGSYSATQTVTLSTTTAGASIRYTTDGTAPSETAGTLYGGAITVSATTTLKAIAYETSYTDSSVASATFTINSGGGSNWYNDAWSYQQAITIAHTKVSGSSSLLNFPVLISLPSNASLAANAQASGNDILFTDSSGINKLNHEIETYNSATGRLIAWVQVPSVSPAADTVIYMYYGNSAAGNQQNQTLVWDANYQGVWHLVNGATLSAADSTSNGNNGIISNATAATGEIDGGARFNGGNAWVDLGGGAGLRITGPITAEAWMNVTGWPANGYPEGLLGMGYSYASGWTGWMLETSTDNGGNHYLSWTSSNGTPHGVTSPSTLATGTWHHLVGAFDGSTWTMYLDGVANGSSADHTAPVNTGDDVVAGGLSTNGFGTIFVFNGLLDELRISNTARSSGWIATEYNNQLNPGAFVNVGAAQTNGN
jgi:hypothetical protein